MRKMNIIRRQNHDIYSMKINKIALSANDDERYVMKVNVYTLPLREYFF